MPVFLLLVAVICLVLLWLLPALGIITGLTLGVIARWWPVWLGLAVWFLSLGSPAVRRAPQGFQNALFALPFVAAGIWAVWWLWSVSRF